MIAHESYEAFKVVPEKMGIKVDYASFCAGHDYVLHSEQVQGLVKALEQLASNKCICDLERLSIAREALAAFKGV